jgi:hypothetical protein
MSAHQGAWTVVAATLVTTGVLAAAAMTLPNLWVLSTAFALAAVGSSRSVIGASRSWLRTLPRPSDSQLDTVLWALSCAGPVYMPFHPPPSEARVDSAVIDWHEPLDGQDDR